jgi:hypothetical protein
MKILKILLTSFLFVFSVTVSAEGEWYVGATSGYYDLGKSDHWAGDVALGQVGFQAGRYFNDDVSIELGYSDNFSSEAFSIMSLSTLFWLGDYSSEYRPYFLIGYNSYDVDQPSFNPPNYSANQVMIGGGVGTDMGADFQLRVEGRYMVRKGVNEDDLAIQLSINRFFD